MDWPLSLDIVIGLVTPSTVVVPGHGAPVDRDFVETQRNEIGVLAETIRDLATRGVPADQAVAAAQWPYSRRGRRDGGPAGLRAAAAQPEAAAADLSGERSCNRAAVGYGPPMTTTPQEPSPQPEVVPSGDPPPIETPEPHEDPQTQPAPPGGDVRP